jgi:hypothetical protein
LLPFPSSKVAVNINEGGSKDSFDSNKGTLKKTLPLQKESTVSAPADLVHDN